ncbi:hypothetical protein E1301_Tti006049 [Triplophysa tibetana]|uniref:Uncharacterized protein n=1 Tax=Triplophysa tibetana TaxID=1572043 RepID=A0A5A9PZZ5_9TELE|nr:hypothetical protein E1301_Tti006049 [Triplophysa tibetana]
MQAVVRNPKLPSRKKPSGEPRPNQGIPLPLWQKLLPLHKLNRKSKLWRPLSSSILLALVRSPLPILSSAIGSGHELHPAAPELLVFHRNLPLSCSLLTQASTTAVTSSRGILLLPPAAWGTHCFAAHVIVALTSYPLVLNRLLVVGIEATDLHCQAYGSIRLMLVILPLETATAVHLESLAGRNYTSRFILKWILPWLPLEGITTVEPSSSGFFLGSRWKELHQSNHPQVDSSLALAGRDYTNLTVIKWILP